MKRRSKALIAAASLMCALGLGLGVWSATRNNVEAADHLDPPMRTNPDPAFAGAAADRAADIGDVYTWHYTDGDGNQKVVVAMTYAGPNPAAADQEATYDEDVLYTLRFMSGRDFFAGQNSSVIIVEFDADDLTPGADDTISVWGTTGRDNT